MNWFFDDNPSWEHQFRRLIAEVSDGGGEFYEILATAKKLRGGSTEDWYQAWMELAEISEKLGTETANKGRLLTAKVLFLRASNYFRMANFYLDEKDPRELETYSRLVSSFRRAMNNSHPSVQLVEIPYEESKLTGYLTLPSHTAENPLPAVIFMGGADSVKEEYYFRGARQAVERGLACLLLDGPGQGDALRLRKLYAVPNYEKPIAAAIDFLQQRKDVDRARIGLVCASLGGYYALRAAAFERRIRVCVAWAACYDVLKDVYNFFPPIQRRLQWIVGAKNPQEAQTKLKEFSLQGIVEKIQCPLLILHGEEDYICSIEAAYRAYREARCEKELVIFKKGQLGACHCQQDNISAAKNMIFDWVHERLAA